MVVFKKAFSALIMKFFDKKKSEYFKAWKISKQDQVRVLFRQKCCHLLDLRLHQIGKAQNVPVLADRLVQNTIYYKMQAKCLI